MTSYISLFCLVFLLMINQNVDAQNVVNQYDYEKSFSYNVADSSVLIGKEKGKLIYYKDSKEYLLKGNIGHFSENGKWILTLEKKMNSATIYLYNNEAKLLKSKVFNEALADVSFGKNKRTFYGLVETRKADDPSDGQILVLSKKLKVKKRWSTHSPKYNSVNICYHPKTKTILVGAGIVGSFLTTKGDTLGLYETPNTGIVQVNSNNHFSILHQYSDGSSLEVFTSQDKSIDIMKMLDKDYPVDFDGYTVKTSIPVFQSWDVSEEGKVVTLDHSKAISLFAQNGEYIKDVQKTIDANFVFFVNENTIGYYSLEKKKLFFKSIQ